VDASSWWYSHATPVSTLIAVCATCCRACCFFRDGRASRVLRRTCVGVLTGALVGGIPFVLVGAVVGSASGLG
jgi:hypothetical protein